MTEIKTDRKQKLIPTSFCWFFLDFLDLEKNRKRFELKGLRAGKL